MFKELSKLKFKYCLIEKPAGLNKSEFLEIKRIVLKKKMKLFINYIRLYQKKYSIFKKYLLKENYAVFYYNRGLMNNGSHLISFCLFNFGKVKNIKIIKRNKSFNGDIQPSFLLEFKNIKVYFINVNQIDISFNELNIINKQNIIYTRDNFNSAYVKKISYTKEHLKEKILFLKDNKFQLTVLNKIHSYMKTNSKTNIKLFDELSDNFLNVHEILNLIKNKNRIF